MLHAAKPAAEVTAPVERPRIKLRAICVPVQE